MRGIEFSRQAAKHLKRVHPAGIDEKAHRVVKALQRHPLSRSKAISRAPTPDASTSRASSYTRYPGIRTSAVAGSRGNRAHSPHVDPLRADGKGLIEGEKPESPTPMTAPAAYSPASRTSWQVGVVRMVRSPKTPAGTVMV